MPSELSDLGLPPRPVSLSLSLSSIFFYLTKSCSSISPVFFLSFLNLFFFPNLTFCCSRNVVLKVFVVFISLKEQGTWSNNQLGIYLFLPAICRFCCVPNVFLLRGSSFCGVWSEMQSLVLISSLDHGWDSFWFIFITLEPYHSSSGMERKEIRHLGKFDYFKIWVKLSTKYVLK